MTVGRSGRQVDTTMDDGLKQRLVGAIVLMAIAVLFLPSLFNQNARRTVDLNTQVPPEPSVVAELLEVADPEQPEGIPAAKPFADNYPHEEAEAVSERQVAVEEEPADEQPTSRAAAEPVEPQAPELNEEGVPDGWSLQIGSFQSPDRAHALLERLQSEGFKSYVREGRVGQGTVHRVFVGPKINRAAAEAEKRAIDERFETNALVVEFSP